MKRSLFFPAILLCSSLTAAEPLVWNFDRPGIPKLQNGAHAAPGTARTPEGGRTLQIWAEYDTEELKSPPVLLFPSAAGVFSHAAAVKVSFFCRAEFPGKLKLHITARTNTSRSLSESATLNFSTNWQKLSVILKRNGNLTEEPFFQLPRIQLLTVKRGQKIEIGPIEVVPLSAGEIAQ